MLHGEGRRRLDEEDALKQALGDFVVIVFVEVPYFVLLVLPAVETGLKSVRVADAHAVDLGPDRVFLVLGDAVGALRHIEPALHLLHRQREEPVVLLFTAFARKKEGAESALNDGYFLPWPWRSIMYLMVLLFERLRMTCLIFTISGVSY